MAKEKKARSREGRKPLEMDAPVRQRMEGICRSCAFAGDMCLTSQRQRGELGYVVKCNGYE